MFINICVLPYPADVFTPLLHTFTNPYTHIIITAYTVLHKRSLLLILSFSPRVCFQLSQNEILQTNKGTMDSIKLPTACVLWYVSDQPWL